MAIFYFFFLSIGFGLVLFVFFSIGMRYTHPTKIGGEWGISSRRGIFILEIRYIIHGSRT